MSDPIFDEYQLRKFEDYKILERGKRMSKKEPTEEETIVFEWRWLDSKGQEHKRIPNTHLCYFCFSDLESLLLNLGNRNSSVNKIGTSTKECDICRIREKRRNHE